MSKKVNYQEFKIAGEASPLIKIRIKKIKNALSRGRKDKGRGVLIVDTCIIGDFLSYLPALRAIIKNKGVKVDLIVSPALESLSERINGINKVFTAKSSYNRNVEQNKKSGGKISQMYKTLVVIRISPEAYEMIKDLKFSEIITSDLVYFKYLVHVAKKILIKSPIKQSRQIGFEIIGIKEKLRDIDKKIDLNDLFNFKDSDYNFLKKISEINTKEKKILVHTGSGWEGRLWNNKNWINLIKRVNELGKFRFIFIGGTDQEKRTYEEVKRSLNFKVYSVIGKLDLKELFLFMKRSNYFIGMDSGPRNLAHLADLRSITLRGPGLYFMPLNKKDKVIDNLKSASTLPFFFQKKGNVENISVDRVFKSFKKLIRK